MQRGEVWWAAVPSRDDPHPVVVVSPTRMAQQRLRITIVPVTSVARDIPTEVRLDRRDGLRRPCVAATQDVVTIRKRHLMQRIAVLGAERMREIDRAAHIALGIPLPCDLQ